MTHQLHPFIITRIVQNYPLQQHLTCTLPASISWRENSCNSPSYIDSQHDQHIPIPVTLHLTASLDQEESNSQGAVSILTNTVYGLARTVASNSVGFLFNQPEYSSSSGHTVISTITTTLATSEPRVNGASSSNNSSSSMLCQSRPPPCPSQSGWQVTGGNEMRTHQVPRQEPAQDLPMGLQLLGESSIQSNRDHPLSPIHHRRQQLLHHDFPQPATPPPTPATVQGNNGDQDHPLTPPPDEPWEGLSSAADAPPNGDGVSSGGINSNTILDPGQWD